ncbi:MAG: four helix bundle protein [Prevotella sp.]|nr:four helix bundle protein [Prevotella sp.]
MIGSYKGENDVYDLSFDFAVRIVKLIRHLRENKNEYVMSKQLLRCGTSIGANVHEAEFAQSRPDFKSKMNIALKEANETGYWLKLLKYTDYLTEKEYDSINTDCGRLIAVLINIVKNTKI